jgi:hypothetical protein
MIYFIRDGDAVKIGYAINPRSRLTTLRTGNSRPISILGVMDGSLDDEHRLHQRFTSEHIRGEWFKLTPQIIQFIEENCRPVIEVGRVDTSEAKTRLSRRGVAAPPPKTEAVHRVKEWLESCIIKGDGASVQDLDRCHVEWSFSRGIYPPLAWCVIGRILPRLGYERRYVGAGSVYLGMAIRPDYPGAPCNRNEILYRQTQAVYFASGSRPYRERTALKLVASAE